MSSQTALQHRFVVPGGANYRMSWRFKITEAGAPISLAGSVATQSSDYFAGAPFVASNAIDGNPSTFTHTAAGDSSPAWTLTLPIETEIGSIVLTNRTQGWRERLRNITIQVFSDAAGTVPVFTSEALNPDNVLNGPTTLSVSTGRVTGRVIRMSRGLSDSPVGDDAVLAHGEVEIASP